MKQEPARLTLPSEVKAEEWKYIQKRRIAAEATSEGNQKDCSELPLVGISLSGGGIRSATFSLGILQALSENNVLRLCDYLSTVSGGGYIGSCLTSLMTHRTDKDGKIVWDASQCDLAKNMPFHERRHIHHLRKHGDFLLLGRGFARREVMRSIGVLILGLTSTLLMYLLVQVILSSYIIAQTTAFAGPDFWTDMLQKRATAPVAISGQLEMSGAEISNFDLSGSLQGESSQNSWPGLSKIWQRVWESDKDTTFFTANRLSLVVIFVLGNVVAFFVSRHFANETLAGPKSIRPKTGEMAVDIQQVLQLKKYAAAHIAMGLLIPLIYTMLRPPASAGASGDSSLAGLLFHPAYFSGALFMTSIFYIRNAFTGGLYWDKQFRSLFGAIYGVSLYALVFCLALLALTIAVWWVVSGEMWAWVAGSGIVSMVLTRLLARQKIDRPDRSSLIEFLVAVAMHIGLILSVLVFLGASFVLCTNALVVVGINSQPTALLCMLAAIVLFIGLGYAINLNRVSLHYFYRDRLAETYLQTEDNTGSGLEVVRDSADLKLTELGNHPDVTNSCPYHLIVCALNLAGSRDLSRRDRKSDHFLFSPYFCGSTTTGYVRTEKYRDGQTQLNTAMTISGAAFSSAMGFYTSIAQAFATTLFNLRLGYWMVNPRVYDQDEGSTYFQSVVTKPSPDQATRKWNDVDESTQQLRRIGAGAKFDEADHKKVTLADSGLIFWPWFLLLEFAALTHSDSPLINLSDGGHTGDNIGLYTLFQRRCKLIIACDGEADPDYSFGSLASAVRQIYVDENVEVMIDLDQLRPKEKGSLAQRHYLIGKIVYPDCDNQGGTENSNSNEPEQQATVGWLIYLKSSLADTNPPVSVKSYSATHSHFPHETTVDQIFKDNQFEAYRTLGAHVATTALEELMREDTKDAVLSSGPLSAEQLMEWCESRFKANYS